jgi:uncharacterized protein YfkK (UPF0435 family)
MPKGHSLNRTQALPPPGSPPFGYKRGKDKYVIDRAKATIVKEFFENFLLYGSLRGAVRHIAQKFNKVVAVSTGRHWLISPVYRGDLAYQVAGQTQVLRDTHKPIITRDEAAQVDRLLRRNKSLPPKTASAERSLAGLVFCSTCQGKLIVTSVTVRNKGRAYLYLRCLSCPLDQKCKAIAYNQILDLTIAKICTDLVPAVSGVGTSRLSAIKAQIETTIAQKFAVIEQMPTLVDTGILDTETADLRAYNLRTEIAKLEDQKSQLPPINLEAIAQTVSIPQFWQDLSESERRFYFREFIRAVKIDLTNPAWNLQLIFAF